MRLSLSIALLFFAANAWGDLCNSCRSNHFKDLRQLVQAGLEKAADVPPWCPFAKAAVSHFEEYVRETAKLFAESKRLRKLCDDIGDEDCKQLSTLDFSVPNLAKRSFDEQVAQFLRHDLSRINVPQDIYGLNVSEINPEMTDGNKFFRERFSRALKNSDQNKYLAEDLQNSSDRYCSPS